MVLYKGGTLMIAGAVVGIVGALLLSPVLESMGVGVSPRGSGDVHRCAGGPDVGGPGGKLRPGVPRHSGRPHVGHAEKVGQGGTDPPAAVAQLRGLAPGERLVE